MKKVLFLSLVLAMGMTSFAQKTIVKKTDAMKQSVTTRVLNLNEVETPAMNFQSEVMPKAATVNSSKGFEEWTTMTTNYDLQTNSALGNRVATWADGSAAVVATWDYSGSTSFPDRGAGYNYYDGSSFGDEPTARVESVRSGWPSIAPLGEGEIMASHASGTNIYKRATKGEGEWEQVANLATNTWPRIATTGNGQYVHVINGNQDSNNTLLNYVYYYRSTDGGQTFSEAAYPPEVDIEGEYNFNIGADDYVMAANGNTIAILFGGLTYDLFYIISRDNGETWEKQVVAKHPYPSFDWSLYDQGLTSERDTIWSDDNSHSIAIDDKGTVHVTFALGRWVPASNSGSYSYWPYTIGIVYWNSEYVNEQGGHEIPAFGQWSGDAEHPEWALNGPNGISSTLNDMRIDALAAADGYKHLNIFGWPDENGDGVYDLSENWGNRPDGTYRSLGMATMPAISVDNQGNVAILYSVLSETRVESVSGFYYRSAYVSYKDYTDSWYCDENGDNLSGDFVHQFEEVYSTTAGANGKDGEFWVCYSGDETLGLYLDEDQNELTDNIIYMVKLAPECLGVGENQTINPMTNVRVYPNPVQDVLNIEVNASQASEMNIAVYNITGQKVMETSANLSMGINVPSVNVSSLNSGIYFVTVKANGFENTMKFVVK